MRADTCAACGSTINLQYHHLIPRSLGGADDETNLITLCGECHAKAHGIQADWRHSELTRRGLARKKAKREITGGGIPYGCRLTDDGVTLEADPFESKVAWVAREMRESGMTLRKISALMVERGVVSRSGRPFAAAQIKRMTEATALRRGQGQ